MELKPLIDALPAVSHIKADKQIVTADTVVDNTTTPQSGKLDMELRGLIRLALQQSSRLLNQQLANSEQLLPQISKTLQHILASTVPNADTVSNGLAALLAARKLTINELMGLANSLQLLAQVQTIKQAGANDITSVMLQRLGQQAQQLLAEVTTPTTVTKSTQEQVLTFLNQTIPNTIPQTAIYQPLMQLLKLFAPTAPMLIQDQAKLNMIPELAQVWAVAQQLPAASLELSPSIFSQFSQALQTLAQFKFSNTAELSANNLTQLKQLLPAASESNLTQNMAAKQLLAPFFSLAPAIVRQAAHQLNRSQLVSAWLLAQPETVALLKTPATILMQNAATIRHIAFSMGQMFKTEGEITAQSTSLSLQLPVHGEPGLLYPAHIHIYHEHQDQKSAIVATSRDTWLRVTLEPEYIGSVELVFHLYGDEILDIKVVFADKDIPRLFAESEADIRDACLDFPFELRDLSII